MNNNRRQRLKEAIPELESVKRIIDEVCRDEDIAFDNLPENFQDSERGERMQEVIETLDELFGSIEEVINGIYGVL